MSGGRTVTLGPHELGEHDHPVGHRRVLHVHIDARTNSVDAADHCHLQENLRRPNKQK
jgi:hypothetical protein